MEKKRVLIFVAGQRFSILTDEEERYVLDLASGVDARISSIVMGQDMIRERAAVLAALDYADDCEKNRRELNEIKEQVKDYLAEIEKLSGENERLKAELSKAKLDAQTLEDARAEGARARRECEALKAQVHALKKQIEVMMRDDTSSAPSEVGGPAVQAEEVSAEEIVEDSADENTEAEPAESEQAQPEITAADDLFFDAPREEEPVKPKSRKEKKNRHEHKHENPYRQQHMQSKEQKGYTQQRQYSLFDDEDE